jgi:nucleotide-binding universal stress UspA family protein
MYQHILFPTDGSESAQRALEHVCEMARAFKARVSVLHVYSLSLTLTNPNYLPAVIQGQARESLQREGERLLHDTRRRLEADATEVRTYNIEGVPKIVICEFAQSHQCNLIILGTRGMGQLSLAGSVNHHGSTSSYVIHHSPGIAVMVIA